MGSRCGFVSIVLGIGLNGGVILWVLECDLLVLF